jgi:hypothetical protein
MDLMSKTNSRIGSSSAEMLYMLQLKFLPLTDIPDGEIMIDFSGESFSISSHSDFIISYYLYISVKASYLLIKVIGESCRNYL